MTDTVAVLIKLYAEHGADGVRKSQYFRDLCDRHERDTTFDAIRASVEELARFLEKNLDGLDARDQVRTCLGLFLGYRDDEKKREMLRRSVEYRWANWTPPQRKYFSETCHKLAKWHDYFLSFTSHNPVDGEVLPVNRIHRPLLRRGLDRPIEPPETYRTNLLAKLVHTNLRQYLKGFYYPEHRTDEDVEAKLKRAAGEAFAFVQILEASMFGRSPNFCNLEYVAAAADASRTVVVVLPEPREQFMRRATVHGDLQAWYNAVMAKDAIELEHTRSQRRIDELLKELDRVIDEVVEARRRVIESVPSSAAHTDSLTMIEGNNS